MIATQRPLRIGIIVGEISGDALGAKLIPALRERFGSRTIEFFGVAGPAMEQAGLSSLFPLEDIAVMGIVPVIKRLPSLLRRIRETSAAMIAFQPDLLLIIDSPDFTHRVAKQVRRNLPTCRLLIMSALPFGRGGPVVRKPCKPILIMSWRSYLLNLKRTVVWVVHSAAMSVIR